MKKLLFVLIMLFCATLTYAGGANLWLYGDRELLADEPEESIGARLGYRFGDTEQWEIGLQSQWYPSRQTDLPQNFAVYGLYTFPDPIIFPQPIPVEWLPSEIEAKAYFGAQIGVNFDGDGVISGPLAGIVLQDIIFVEYQYANYSGDLSTLSNEHKVIFGLRWKIP